MNGADSPASRTERLVLAGIGLLGLTFLVAPMLIVVLALKGTETRDHRRGQRGS